MLYTTTSRVSTSTRLGSCKLTPPLRRQRSSHPSFPCSRHHRSPTFLALDDTTESLRSSCKEALGIDTSAIFEHKLEVSNCTRYCPSERLVGVWQTNFSEDQICSGQGFDLIIGAIRHHFRSYLESEPEVQAEIAFVPIDDVSKRNFFGIHVAYLQQTS